jgi:hypothetical protein
MKILCYAIVAILIGVAAGVGTAWHEVERTPSQFSPDNRTVAALQATCDESGRGSAKVDVVGGLVFDFGTGQRNSKLKHAFVIRNIGDEVLTLSTGATSCSCSFSELKTDKLGPGESTEISLEWHLTTAGDEYRQTAEVYTNDPRQPTLTLMAQGTVTDWVRLEPRELVLSNVSVTEGAQVGFSLHGFQVEDLAVVEHRFANPETAEYFELEFAEQDPSQVQMTPAPSASLWGTLTVKSGLPLGPLNQTIHLKTDIEQAPELELPISGSVVGDISVVGAGSFRQQNNLLIFGQVDRDKGIETTLRILIRGPHRHDVQMKIKETDPPDVLAVQWGEPVPINNGLVYMHPLSVSVPRGSRPVARMGFDREDYGRIVIETTHPDTPLLTLRVRFAVK